MEKIYNIEDEISKLNKNLNLNDENVEFIGEGRLGGVYK